MQIDTFNTTDVVLRAIGDCFQIFENGECLCVGCEHHYQEQQPDGLIVNKCTQEHTQN